MRLGHQHLIVIIKMMMMTTIIITVLHVKNTTNTQSNKHHNSNALTIVINLHTSHNGSLIRNMSQHRQHIR